MASWGSNTVGSRLRTEVPVISPANNSALSSVPIAVLRPRRATAIPKNASLVVWMSFVAIRNCQPRTSTAPPSPAKPPQIAITRM